MGTRSAAVPTAALLAALVGTGCATKAPTPTAFKPAQIAERSKPATVLVMIKHSATLSVPKDSAPLPGAQQRLAQAMRSRVQPGMNQQELAALVFEEMLGNWRQYLRPTSTRSIPASITSVGSGFFVTPDGYAVTNAHVVGGDERELKAQFAQKALGSLLGGAVRDFPQTLRQVSPERRERLIAAAAKFYTENMTIDEIRRDATLLTGVGQAGMGTTSKPIPVEIVKNAVGEPIPGKDVAVVKASGQNFPTLKLGDDRSLQTGEEIYPYGYPADATFYPSFDASSATEPSFTRGVVSARKTMAGGWEVIQTDAAIRGGNSGGPVLDDRGEVIGLATFGLVDQKSGASAQGANFVVPTTVVREILGRANVTPQDSPVSQEWTEAQNAMDVARYKEAMTKLDEIETLRPGIPAVAAARSRAAAAIRAGKDATPSPLVPLAIGGGVVLALLAAVGVFFATRRKGPRPPVPPVASSPPTIG